MLYTICYSNYVQAGECIARFNVIVYDIDIMCIFLSHTRSHIITKLIFLAIVINITSSQYYYNIVYITLQNVCYTEMFEILLQHYRS